MKRIKSTDSPILFSTFGGGNITENPQNRRRRDNRCDCSVPLRARRLLAQ
jgi:hypothetical protein